MTNRAALLVVGSFLRQGEAILVISKLNFHGVLFFITVTFYLSLCPAVFMLFASRRIYPNDIPTSSH